MTGRGTRRRRVGAALVGAALAGALAGCAREGERAGYTTLVPVARIVEMLRPTRVPGVVHGREVSLERENRRSTFLPAQALGIATLERTDGDARYRLTTVPDEARAWGRVHVTRRGELRGRQTMLGPELVDLRADPQPTIPVGRLERAGDIAALTLSGAVRARGYQVETRDLTVPAKGVLAFGIGVHAPGTRLPVPLYGRVTVVDGEHRTTVWRGLLAGTHTGWREVRVPLDAWAGRRVRLRFSSRMPGPSATLGMTMVFGEPVLLGPRTLPARPPNVVLVSMDALRAASVHATGCARETTPTIDRLGADGALFENAYSAGSFTLPGHLSMLTGLWFRTHRALTPTSILPPDHRTLPERLQSAGYATAAFTTGAWIMPWIGFRRGFDTYREQPAVPVAPPPAALPYESFTRGLAWMAENRDRPFFVFLHNYQVHQPYLPPPVYDRLFDRIDPPAPEEEQLRLRYEQEIRYADDQVRALLDGIDWLGLRNDTLVILTADHGEQFREHGKLEHTYDVHDQVAHVPLVMRLPGAIPAGRRVVEVTSTVDIVPTVLDLLGLPPLHGVDGTSLLPLIEGTADRLPREGVFIEAEGEANLGWVSLTAAYTRTHACIDDARAGTVECWDRRVDPWQLGSPLAPDDRSPGAVAARALVAAHVAAKPAPDGTTDVNRGLGAPTPEPTPPVPAAPAPGDGLDDERREQLRSLGYIE